MNENEKKRSVLEDFLGTECAGCGAVKRPRMSHCAGCYHRLPKKMQSELYRRFGQGYEEAFAASVEWLRKNQPPGLFSGVALGRDADARRRDRVNHEADPAPPEWHIGDRVRFAHGPGPFTVSAVTADSMVELDGMAGQFAASLFVPLDTKRFD